MKAIVIVVVVAIIIIIKTTIIIFALKADRSDSPHRIPPPLVEGDYQNAPRSATGAAIL